MTDRVEAACTERDFQSGRLRNYEGTIGSSDRVQFTFTLSKGEVSGVYLHATELKDIRFSGRISHGRLQLNEFDASGEDTASLEGEFVDQDPRWRFNGKLKCEVIVGSWRKKVGTEKLEVYLSETFESSGTLDHRYEIAGASDDDLIHRNALRFWQAVVTGDKETVAAQIRYPIRVQVGGIARTVSRRRELISRFHDIFSPAYRAAVRNAIPRNMFARDKGIMLGDGEVWFGSSGQVIALNNY